jgi:spore germination protein GerM
LTQDKRTAYYITVAANSKKKTSGFGWFLFWLAFIIGIIFLFMMNRETIQNSLRETRVLERLFHKSLPDTEEDSEEPEPSGIDAGTTGTASEPSGALGNSGVSGNSPGSGVSAGEEKPGAGTVAANEKPDSGGAASEKTVSRTVYLIRVDNDGAILPTRVQRTLPQSDSPLKDALEAVIRGPQTEEEKKKDYLSLIPPKSKILNITVQGSTAYISFSEDFLFNTYGIEGYAAQLRQVVWTATEFSNVKDVQILIDGKRVDYLGEGIWIGSPVNRTAP